MLENKVALLVDLRSCLVLKFNSFIGHFLRSRPARLTVLGSVALATDPVLRVADRSVSALMTLANQGSVATVGTHALEHTLLVWVFRARYTLFITHLEFS